MKQLKQCALTLTRNRAQVFRFSRRHFIHSFTDPRYENVRFINSILAIWTIVWWYKILNVPSSDSSFFLFWTLRVALKKGCLIILGRTVAVPLVSKINERINQIRKMGPFVQNWIHAFLRLHQVFKRKKKRWMPWSLKPFNNFSYCKLDWLAGCFNPFKQ